VPDVALSGDARLVVEDLIPLVDKGDRAEWLEQIAAWRQEFPLHYPKKGGLRPQYILDRLDKLGGRDSIVVTDVGQHQMWAAQFLRTTRQPSLVVIGRRRDHGLWFSCSHRRQTGTSERSVWAVVGDGGFQMTLSELATAGGAQAWRSRSSS